METARETVHVIALAAVLVLAGCATPPRQLYDGPVRPLEDVAVIRCHKLHGSPGRLGIAAVNGERCGGTRQARYPTAVTVAPGAYVVRAFIKSPIPGGVVAAGAGAGGSIVGLTVILAAELAVMEALQAKSARQSERDLEITVDAGHEYLIHGRRFVETFYWIEDSATGEVVSGLRFAPEMLDLMDSEQAVAFVGARSAACQHALVCATTNAAVIAWSAEKSSWYMIRKAAVRKLSDQGVLGRIAREDPHWSVRRAATKRIDDQAVLAEVARSEPNNRVRVEAVERLYDQAALGKVATEDTSRRARTIAIDRLFDVWVLQAVARTAEEKHMRAYARRRLAEISRMKSCDPQLREAAGTAYAELTPE